ncbi:chemotaxis protein CheW [Sphingobium algorifonticola]|uniref:Chemotaxis protein CheW n=1 Tax=Sphingobium algorifonticola TaxID=2008318 RepID=A0A437JBJ8_9SPHN|nr:chemotaxis protein CheW [Sphingobium algorifonticola]RVT43150.1 chemotaxis protein CheW [Sphingobium algorifonticola]
MTDPLYLFARVAGTPIAVRSEDVEAVVRFADISPVPGMPRHIAGLSALRSRVLTMIDIAALIDDRSASRLQGQLAIVADISGHSYGLIVESVSDICAVQQAPLPLHSPLSPAWAPFVQAIVENEGTAHLLVSLASFIDPALTAQAA